MAVAFQKASDSFNRSFWHRTLHAFNLALFHSMDTFYKNISIFSLTMVYPLDLLL